MPFRLSWHRLSAIIVKEFIQMRRDRLTFAMMVVLPLIQLTLFGYAINTNPKHLPTVIVNGDYSLFTRIFTSALQNTTYYKVINNNATEDEATKMLARGRTQFIVNFPVDFTHDLIRGNRPNLLVTVDASDPTASGYAISSLNQLASTVFNTELNRGLDYLIPNLSSPFNLIIHQKYNPENISQYNVVPGLTGVILTMTMIMITGLAITRERERGTMENLLSMPIKPIEVMIGKIIPYVMVGYVQELLILTANVILFQVPFGGSLILLLIATFPFIIANLSVGLTFSTIAKNQLQAVQMSFFFFLPSILLSGFMFPFYGMPEWAQYLGETLPLTHFLRIVRGIMLKENNLIDILPQIWPILLFILVVLTIAVKRYRETLD